jgi:23S rRNA G2445 N2-methylase RlmL
MPLVALASRVLLALAEFPAPDAEALYAGMYEVAWEDHIPSDGTIAIDVAGTSSGLTHTRFVAQRPRTLSWTGCASAPASGLRWSSTGRPSASTYACNVNGRRSPSISRERRSITRLPVAREQVAAPLKENLAAALLVRAGWPEIAQSGGPLVDPMCGSGTFLVEGALIASDQAPGLLRDYWGFAAGSAMTRTGGTRSSLRQTSVPKPAASGFR